MNVSAETMKLDRECVEGPAAPASIGNDVGLRGIAAVLPPHTRDLDELQRSGLLVSDRSALEELGFEKVHVCDAAHDVVGSHWNPPGWLWPEAGVEPAEIDVLIWASALAETHVKDPGLGGTNANRRTVGQVQLSGELAAGRTTSRSCAGNRRGAAGMRWDVQCTFHGACLTGFRPLTKEHSVCRSRCLARRRTSRNSLQFDQ